jgi:hypothetical protein
MWSSPPSPSLHRWTSLHFRGRTTWRHEDGELRREALEGPLPSTEEVERNTSMSSREAVKSVADHGGSASHRVFLSWRPKEAESHIKFLLRVEHKPRQAVGLSHAVHSNLEQKSEDEEPYPAGRRDPKIRSTLLASSQPLASSQNTYL